MSSVPGAAVRPAGAFGDVATPNSARGAKVRPSPFCIRLSPDERAYLEQLAGNRPLGAYIRDRLVGDRAQKRRELRRPKIDQEQYAALLAALGHSHLSSNLNQLAKSANMGTLDVSQDLEWQLQEAYDAVLEMRRALFLALGLKPEGKP